MALVIFLFAISCNNKTNENFDWLLGQWQRTNEEQGKTTFEDWKKTAEFSYSGIGFTLQDGDTVKKEKMKLIKQNGTWDFVVKVPEETDAVIFEMTESNKSSFTCINDSIDFPNRIKYWTENNHLKATVSGIDLNAPFEFKKIE